MLYRVFPTNGMRHTDNITKQLQENCSTQNEKYANYLVLG